MVARTRESSPSQATQAQGRPLMIFASGKNHLASFLLFLDPHGKFKKVIFKKKVKSLAPLIQIL
jgi:hypothetical protein